MEGGYQIVSGKTVNMDKRVLSNTGIHRYFPSLLWKKPQKQDMPGT